MTRTTTDSTIPADFLAHDERGRACWHLDRLSAELRERLGADIVVHVPYQGAKPAYSPLAISVSSWDDGLMVWSEGDHVATIRRDGTLELHPGAHEQSGEALEDEERSNAEEWLSEELVRDLAPRGYAFETDWFTGIPEEARVIFSRPFVDLEGLISELEFVREFSFSYGFDREDMCDAVFEEGATS